jgi:pseudaminic acid cytidylyltransferase
MKTVCMIPARGGSKRIPGKNIKSFLGKPIITYPIEVAKASGIFDNIIVYTDDLKTKELVIEINRLNPKEQTIFFKNRFNATDTESLTDMLLNFLNYETFNNIDYLCILLPTAVFVKPIEIEIASDSISYDGIITFCKYSHPVERCFRIFTERDSKIFMKHPEYEFIRTQDIEDSYYDAGQMYFLNVKSFLKQKRIFMDNIYPIIIDAVDIDNPEDWKKAEAFYKVIYNG